MAKRLTDTEKWQDPWFSELGMKEQIFWLYVLDRCDHAGIWKANWPEVGRRFGGVPDMSQFQGRMLHITDEKLFIPKFLVFQYGPDWRKSKIRAHKSAVKILKSMGLLEKAVELTEKFSVDLTLSKPLAKGYLSLSRPLANPSLTLMDTDTDTATDTATAPSVSKDMEGGSRHRDVRRPEASLIPANILRRSNGGEGYEP